MARRKEVKICQLFIGGKWQKSKTTEFGNVMNPATDEVLARVPFCTPAEVNAAIEAAAAAFPSWSNTPVVERARLLFRFKQQLEEHQEELAHILTGENGKTLIEARGSIRRGIEMVEFACGMPTLMMGDSLENIAPGIDCQTIRQPLGVCVGITPFNFPAMVPLWMYPIAIACGNTFVLKPSEKTPLSAIRILELLNDCGLPPGVVNLIYGTKEVVDVLLAHPRVKAVSFVGSSSVAAYVYQTAAAQGKRVQALGGAKNYAVVMPDAVLEKAVPAIMDSAFGSAGERCLACTIVLAVGNIGDKLVAGLKAAADEFKVGCGTDSDVKMGPLITREHQKRVENYIERGLKEGATLIRDGRGVKVKGYEKGYFVGPTIFDNVKPSMTIAQEEIFGPVLCVMRVKEFDEAISIANASPYGNATSIFTSSGKMAWEYAHRIEAGMVGVNIGVPAPMAFFPFAGWKGSFYGTLHCHGRDGVMFYTEQKVIISRWF